MGPQQFNFVINYFKMCLLTIIYNIKKIKIIFEIYKNLFLILKENKIVFILYI